MHNTFVSIVIPTRNEAKDIAETLEACLAIDYEPKEIIVVDDSTDETPEIVSRYADRGVQLIHREQNRNGCCGARNLGMQMAKGEIVVLMNADNRPRPDFLRRILVHYQNGADFVLVRSTVLNRDNMWAQYIHASGMVHFHDHPNQAWSEGFSCRRTVAEAVGYLPGDFPIPFCRDNLLGANLEQAGFRKVFDLTIPMEHISPDTFRDYWHNQVWRGSFSAPYAYYFHGLPVPLIALREMLKAARCVFLDLLLLPALWRSYRCSRYTPRGWRSIPSLFVVGLVHDAAIIVGNFKGLWRLLRAEGLCPIRARRQDSHHGYISKTRVDK